MTTGTDDKTTAANPARGRASPTSTAAQQPTPSKSDMVIKLLLRGKGATPAELIAATDWQAHSVRAFLSSLRKKGRVIVREARKSGDAAYRIETAAKPASLDSAGLDDPATTGTAESAA